MDLSLQRPLAHIFSVSFYTTPLAQGQSSLTHRTSYRQSKPDHNQLKINKTKHGIQGSLIKSIENYSGPFLLKSLKEKITEVIEDHKSLIQILPNIFISMKGNFILSIGLLIECILGCQREYNTIILHNDEKYELEVKNTKKSIDKIQAKLLKTLGNLYNNIIEFAFFKMSKLEERIEMAGLKCSRKLRLKRHNKPKSEVNRKRMESCREKEGLNKRIDELIKEKDKTKKENFELIKKTGEFNKVTEKANKEKKELNMKIDNLIKENNNLLSKLKNIEKENNELMKKIEQKQKGFHEINIFLKNMKEEYEAKIKELNKKELVNDSDFQELNNSINEAKMRISSLENENNELTRQISNFLNEKLT